MAQNRQYVAELLLKVQAERALKDAKSMLDSLLDTAQDAEKEVQKMLDGISQKYGIDVHLNLEAGDIDRQLQAVQDKMMEANRAQGVNQLGFDVLAKDAERLVSMVGAATTQTQSLAAAAATVASGMDDVATATSMFADRGLEKARIAVLDLSARVKALSQGTLNFEFDTSDLNMMHSQLSAAVSQMGKLKDEGRITQDALERFLSLIPKITGEALKTAKALEGNTAEIEKQVSEASRLDEVFRNYAVRVKEAHRAADKAAASRKKEADDAKKATEQEATAEARRAEQQAQRMARQQMHADELVARFREITGLADFDFDVSNLDGLNDKLDETVAKLQQMATGENPALTEQQYQQAVRALSGLVHSTNAAAKEAHEMGESYTDTAQKIQQAFLKTDQLQRQTAQGMVKTTLASQNVIRIVQDMPYGMMGVTNNIQAWGDSLMYMMHRMEEVEKGSGTMGNAIKASFAGLLTGPMAISLIITAITTLILTWDRLGDTVRKVGERMGLVARSFRVDAEEMKKSIEEVAKAMAETFTPEQAAAFGQLVFREAEGARGRVRDFKSELTDLHRNWEAWGLSVEEYVRRLDELTRDFKEGEQSVEEFTAVQVEMQKQAAKNEGLRALLRNMRDAGNEAVRAQYKIAFFGDTIKQLQQHSRDAARATAEMISDPAERARALYRIDVDEAKRVIREDTQKILSDLRQRRHAADVVGKTDVVADLDIDIQQAVDDMVTQLRAAEVKGRRALQQTLEGLQQDVGSHYFTIKRLMLDQQADSLQTRLDGIALEFEEARASYDRNAAGYELLIEESRRAQAHAEGVATREYMAEVAEQGAELAQLRIRARRLADETELEAMKEGFEKEREVARSQARFRIEEIEERIATQQALIEAGALTPHEVEVALQTIENLNGEIVLTRVQTEQQVKESFKNEAEAAEEFRRRRSEVAQSILREERDIMAARAELASNAGRWDPLQGFAASFAAREVLELDDAKQRLQQALAELDEVYTPEARTDPSIEAEYQARRLAMTENAERDIALIEEKWHKERLAAKRQFWQESVAGIGRIMGTVADVSSSAYNNWRTDREQELDALGYTEEQKSEMIESEGKKRFEQTKRIQQAEAWISGLSGAMGALASVQGMGPLGWAMGAAQATAILAAARQKSREIARMQPGGSAGGSSIGGIAAGNYTALNAGMAAERVLGFETWRSAGGFSPDGSAFDRAAQRMEGAVDRFEQSASNLTATVDTRTAGSVVGMGNRHNSRTNGNR